MCIVKVYRCIGAEVLLQLARQPEMKSKSNELPLSSCCKCVLHQREPTHVAYTQWLVVEGQGLAVNVGRKQRPPCKWARSAHLNYTRYRLR